MSKVYIKTATGHNGEYQFTDSFHWTSTSAARAAKQFAVELNRHLLTTSYLDTWDREKVEDNMAAQIDADHAISEVHENCTDYGWFSAPDFVWVVTDYKTMRPQIKWSAILRELKKGEDFIGWSTLFQESRDENRDYNYTIETHDSI